MSMLESYAITSDFPLSVHLILTFLNSNQVIHIKLVTIKIFSMCFTETQILTQGQQRVSKTQEETLSMTRLGWRGPPADRWVSKGGGGGGKNTYIHHTCR